MYLLLLLSLTSLFIINIHFQINLAYKKATTNDGGISSHFKYERIDRSELHHGYNINKETTPLNNYIIPRNSQYFGSSLDRRALLSDDE